MVATLRIAVILLGIAVVLGLLVLNKHVAEKYWLPAVEDDDGDEPEP